MKEMKLASESVQLLRLPAGSYRVEDGQLVLGSLDGVTGTFVCESCGPLSGVILSEQRGYTKDFTFVYRQRADGLYEVAEQSEGDLDGDGLDVVTFMCPKCKKAIAQDGDIVNPEEAEKSLQPTPRGNADCKV